MAMWIKNSAFPSPKRALLRDHKRLVCCAGPEIFMCTGLPCISVHGIGFFQNRLKGKEASGVGISAICACAVHYS